jgi:hypothetical protein
MPDSRRILFYSDRGGVYQIWAMGLDGSDARQVTAAPSLAIQARVTRDGTRGFANLPNVRKNILFDPRLAAAEQKIEELPMYPGETLFRANAWSPNATRIAGDLLGPPGGLAVYDVGTRQFRHLGIAGAAPVWLPDGKRILYRGDDLRTIQLVDVAGGASRRVLELPREVIGSFDIANDGRELAAVIVNRQADIVLAKLAVR